MDADRLKGTPGADVIRSGAGNDTVDVRGGEVDRVRCGAGSRDRVRMNGKDRATADCEIVNGRRRAEEVAVMRSALCGSGGAVALTGAAAALGHGRCNAAASPEAVPAAAPVGATARGVPRRHRRRAAGEGERPDAYAWVGGGAPWAPRRRSPPSCARARARSALRDYASCSRRAADAGGLYVRSIRRRPRARPERLDLQGRPQAGQRRARPIRRGRSAAAGCAAVSA